MIEAITALSKISVHQGSYMDDLTLVAHNIFQYSEQSADDMRDQL